MNIADILNAGDNLHARQGRKIAQELDIARQSKDDLAASTEANLRAIKSLLDQEKAGRKLIYILTAITAEYPGVSQRQMARELNVSQGTIRDWKRLGEVLIRGENQSPEP